MIIIISPSRCSARRSCRVGLSKEQLLHPPAPLTTTATKTIFLAFKRFSTNAPDNRFRGASRGSSQGWSLWPAQAWSSINSIIKLIKALRAEQGRAAADKVAHERKRENCQSSLARVCVKALAVDQRRAIDWRWLAAWQMKRPEATFGCWLPSRRTSNQFKLTWGATRKADMLTR